MAVFFCNGWTDLGELVGGTGDTGGGPSLADSLAEGRGVQAGWDGMGWGGPVVLVLVGLMGTVTPGPLPAGHDPRAGMAVVRFSRPSRAGSLWKVRGVPESRGKKGPS